MKRLEQAAPASSPVKSKERKDSQGTFVATFEINGADDPSWVVDFLLREGIPHDECGVFASLVTELDTDILSVPRHVVDFIRAVGVGGIDFSFTVV